VPRASNLRLALDDIRGGVLNVHVWPALGWQDIKQRYRRSVLGPLWLTVSMGAMIGAMGPLYGRLFGQDIAIYFGYLATSFVIWQLVSQCVNDTCQSFIGSEGFIKQVTLPLTTYVLRSIWRNMIMFFHNLIVVAIVFLVYPPPISWSALLAPIGLLLFTANAIWFGVVLAMVCARFRDVAQIVQSLTQVALFLTPIFWKPQMLGRHEWANNLNPLYHYLEIIRGPLLGETLNAISWVFSVGSAVLGGALMIFMLSRYRARVPYWV